MRFLIDFVSAAILTLIFRALFPRYWWIATCLSFVVIDYVCIIIKRGSPKFFNACRKYPALAVWYFTKHPDCFCVFDPGQKPILDKSWSGPYKLFVPRGNSCDELHFFTKEPECEKFENEFGLIADELAKHMNEVWAWVAHHEYIDIDPDFVAQEGDKKLSEHYLSLLQRKGIS